MTDVHLVERKTLNRLEVHCKREKNGSSRNEVHGRPRTTNELSLMDAVIEPERLVKISLGQENPRMRMNAAPGSLLWPVGPNRSVSVGFQEFVGLCGLPHFPMTSASP